MPLNAVQMALLAWLDRHANERRYVSGGAVLALDGPRCSEDLDFFMEERDAIARTAHNDLESLKAEGFSLISADIADGKAVACLRWQGDTTKVEWSVDNARRFFPLVRDADFGWRLSLFDIAVNKVRAASTRSEPRDIVDLVLLDRDYMPLGQLVWAAAAKSTMTPHGILDAIVANAGHSASDYDTKVAMAPGASASGLAAALPHIVAEARVWVEEMSALADPGLYGMAFTDESGRPTSCDATDVAAGVVLARASTDNPSAPLTSDAEVPWGEVFQPENARARHLFAIRRIDEALVALIEKLDGLPDAVAAYFAVEDDAVARDLLRDDLTEFRRRITSGDRGDSLLNDIRAAALSAHDANFAQLPQSEMVACSACGHFPCRCGSGAGGGPQP